MLNPTLSLRLKQIRLLSPCFKADIASLLFYYARWFNTRQPYVFAPVMAQGQAGKTYQFGGLKILMTLPTHAFFRGCLRMFANADTEENWLVIQRDHSSWQRLY